MKAGWETKPLGEAAEIVNGGTPKSKVSEYWSGDVQWLTPKDMGQMAGQEIGETPRTISESGLAKSSARLVPERSVILSTRAPIGHLAINTSPMAFNQGCRGLVPKPGLDHVYLYYFLLLNRERLNELGSGTTFKELSAGNLKSLPIPLPPLEEQQRIAAVLDEAFEGLDRARENDEANLYNARELLANTIDSLMVSDGTTTDLKLGELCKFENGDRGKNYPGRKAFTPTGVPFINAGHLLNGPIDWENMNFIPPEHFNRLSNGKVRRGDLLFCLRGSLGKFGTVDTDEPGAIASSLVIVRPGERLLAEYLAAYFESSKCTQMIEYYGNGTAQPNLSAKSLAAFKIALPDLEDQSRVISAVSEVRQSVEVLLQANIAKLHDFDDLRQSLLQKAFAGELT